MVAGARRHYARRCHSASQFDHVVMLAVLEHLRDPEPVLREAYRDPGTWRDAAS